MTIAKDIAEMAKTANTVAELKRLLHTSTASGLTTKKKSATLKRRLKKPEYREWKGKV